MTPKSFSGSIIELRQKLYTYARENKVPLQCNLYDTLDGRKMLVFCKYKKRCHYKVRYREQPRGVCTREENNVSYLHSHPIASNDINAAGRKFLEILQSYAEYQDVRMLNCLVEESASKSESARSIAPTAEQLKISLRKAQQADSAKIAYRCVEPKCGFFVEFCVNATSGKARLASFRQEHSNHGGRT